MNKSLMSPFGAFQVALMIKNPPANSLVGYSPWGHEELNRTEHLSWRRQWQPTPVLLPGKSHGWKRSLVGCRAWGREESDTTERLHFHFSLSCIGKGNGNPLVFLPGESQGRGSLVGCRLWGHTKLETTEVT